MKYPAEQYEALKCVFAKIYLEANKEEGKEFESETINNAYRYGTLEVEKLFTKWEMNTGTEWVLV